MWGIWLLTLLSGTRVGRDEQGNTYYCRPTKKRPWQQERRWVLYKGIPEASKVPPLWYSWLHHTLEHPPAEEDLNGSYPWEKPHLPNLTGTPYAYHPGGRFLGGGKPPKTAGEGVPWSPENLPPKKI